MLREMEKANFTTGWDFRTMKLTPHSCPWGDVRAKLCHSSDYPTVHTQSSMAPCSSTHIVCKVRKTAKTSICCNFVLKIGRKIKSTLDPMQGGTYWGLNVTFVNVKPGGRGHT